MKGSIQLRAYLRDRDAGMTPEEAGARAGFSAAEIKLTEADRAKGNLDDIDLSEPPITIGHNSKDATMSDIIAADQLRLFIERIERLAEEKQGIADDMKDVYAEAKSQGYDTRTMRECVKLRKLEKHVRDEREALLDTYKAAIGLDYSGTPLGAAAVRSAIERTVEAVNAGALGPGVTASMTN